MQNIKSKLFITSLILTLFIGCTTKTDTFTDLTTEDTPIYHIQGFKDKRIRALFSATFKSTTNLDSDDCGYTYVNTGLRRAILVNRMYIASDGNYELKIPIILNNKSHCKFQFVGLQLELRRISGEEIDRYYSRYMLLLDRPLNNLVVEKGYGGGQSTVTDEDAYASFFTDKEYFRIAPDTSFLCRTEWRERLQEEEPSGDFYCVMKINSKDTKFYPMNENLTRRVTNPQFGVDEISSSNLTVNIIADDNGSKAYYENRTGIWADKFREYIPPPKKAYFKNYFN